jgi:alcohol dehydrogenase (cytochrome c)
MNSLSFSATDGVATLASQRSATPNAIDSTVIRSIHLALGQTQKGEGQSLRTKLKALACNASLWCFLGLLAALFCPWAALPTHAEEGGTAKVTFTAEQANNGSTVYAAHCASCHGGSLEGGAGPALSGALFLEKWSSGSKTLGDFFRAVQSLMPAGNPGSLSDRQYTEVVSFILSRNGFAVGDQPFGAQTMTAPMMQGPTAALKVRKPLNLPSPPDTVEQASNNRPGDDEIAQPNEADWLMYNKSLSGQRYSTIDQINSRNAKELIATCIFQLGEVGSFEASPVVYEGMMYVTTPYNTYAIDPRTCAKIWSHDYPSDNTLAVSVSRGSAIYRGKVFRVTPNGHLLALDAKKGALLWDAHVSDKELGYWLSAAPVAYDGKVFIGDGGGDSGGNAHIYALDAANGRVLWTFNVIPTGKEAGADSWQRGAQHGGGSSWSSYTLQPDQKLLYVSVGNPSPAYNGEARPGKNLFTDSVVALDERTGKLQWYVQQVPHDVHDWDTAAAPVIYDQDGKHYMAVANKAGWLYLYDRNTRKLLAQSEATTHVNVEAPITSEGTKSCPGPAGGVQWNGPAYSRHDKLLFVNSVDWCATTRLSEPHYIEGLYYLGGDFKMDPPEEAHGWTKAFDAASGTLVWSRKSPKPMLAALTATAGGVLFTGDLESNFLVLDARTGDTLYRFNTGGAVAGGISTYLVDGKQYVAVASGNNSRSNWQSGGSATIIVFSLSSR